MRKGFKAGSRLVVDRRANLETLGKIGVRLRPICEHQEKREATWISDASAAESSA
jgi:hypothetical protein